MATKRQHRACYRRFRVCGGLAISINGHTFRQRGAIAVVQLDFTARGRACGKVKHIRFVRIAAWKAKAKWIGAQ